MLTSAACLPVKGSSGPRVQRIARVQPLSMALAILLMAAQSRASDYDQQVLADHPISYWKLDELPGSTVAVDSVGSNIGVYQGGVTLGIPGPIFNDSATGADFDGTSGEVVVGAQPTFNLANNFTIEAWIKPSSPGGNQRIVGNLGSSGPTSGYGYGIVGDRMVFSAFGQQDYFANTTTLSTDNWHQVAVSFSASGTASFYLDGQLTQTVSGPSAVIGNGGFTIGAQSATAQEYFNGGLADVAVFHGVLSAAQIAQQYAASQPQNQQFVATLNTGMDGNTKIPEGQIDPNYVFGAGSVAYVGQNPVALAASIPSTYVPDSASPNSRWIGPLAPLLNPGTYSPPGMYYFDTTVNLTGHQASTAQIEGLRASTDNALMLIQVNGQNIFTNSESFTGEFTEIETLGNLGLGYFKPGLNTIRFGVLNAGDSPSSMALRLEGAVYASVPEPSSVVLVVSGLASLLALTGHKRRFWLLLDRSRKH